MNARANAKLQQAGFRDAGELQDAVRTWDHMNKSNRIGLTRGNKKGSKTIDELRADIEKIQKADKSYMTLTDMKSFYNTNTKVSPHKPKERKAKQNGAKGILNV